LVKKLKAEIKKIKKTSNKRAKLFEKVYKVIARNTELADKLARQRQIYLKEAHKRQQLLLIENIKRQNKFRLEQALRAYKLREAETLRRIKYQIEQAKY
jgi:hypothetical protein